ncbi:BZ3500_MvSof-1268-A1-R1_Chr11-1g03208 [Microbotryum saponariae]|uniref:BZ3500_MvSof-1268-A1-R1_Chr11-1g03208 protein n=1 Tax=Microbotryum saponariae TaxID=289078 RepID=A0A2X0LFQ5_9BASI|nr:BZ3501_MvSof-1269-A2-R1_Chr11g02783 [Microbotryum saponariae]SDA03768.1 BZ3500_MvSof-1268-A1-R1_Chr11-1g03208 [Microbotryum saponariae]
MAPLNVVTKSSSVDDEKMVLEHDEVGSPVGVPFSKADERRLIRKIDWKIVPFLSLLYLMSFLDRVNIGQARLSGLEKELKMSGSQYSIALLVFFVSYVFFETPAVIFVRRLRPSRLLPAAMLVWAIVMTLMGVVTSFTGLVVARFFLGMAEAPLFPAACFYLTSWYKRKEQSIRISIFFSAATLAGAFGGLIAHGLAQMDGLGGYAGWRWIFIIEGIITFVIACAAPFVMTDFPEEAKFLSLEEQQEVLRRLKADRGPTLQTEFSWAQVRVAFKDWKTYCFTLIYIGVAEPFYSLSLFTPTIIAALGTYSKSQASLLSTPPFFLGFLTTIISALYSDRLGHRGFFNVFWLSIVVIGFILLLVLNPVHSPKVAYFSLFLCVGGLCPCIANSIAWIGNNFPNRTKRSAAMGLFFSVGNSGGIVSSVVYFKQDAPRFIRGQSVGLGFTLMALFLSLGLTLHLGNENRAKDAKYGPVQEGDEDFEQLPLDLQRARTQAWGLEGVAPQQLSDLAEDHPAFRYVT